MKQLTITQAGKQALINAQHNGTAATKIVSIGITDVHFDIHNPGVSLSNEIKRITSMGGSVTGPTTISVSMRDETNDMYSLRGIGLYLEDGTLFAVFSESNVLLEKASATVVMIQFDFVITDSDVDLSLIHFGDVLFDNPPATEARMGVAKLATEAQAKALTERGPYIMTPGRVKQAIDTAIPPATLTTMGRVRLATLEEALEGKIGLQKDEAVVITPATLEQVIKRRGYPLGAIVLAPYELPPAGCLRPNGANNLPVSLYPEWAKLVGNLYGGDGINTVGVPDYRGEVFRILDDGRGIDPNRKIGTVQDGSAVSLFVGESVTGNGLQFYMDNSDGITRNQTGFVRHVTTNSFTSYSPFHRVRMHNVAVAAFIYAYYPRS